MREESSRVCFKFLNQKIINATIVQRTVRSAFSFFYRKARDNTTSTTFQYHLVR